MLYGYVFNKIYEQSKVVFMILHNFSNRVRILIPALNKLMPATNNVFPFNRVRKMRTHCICDFFLQISIF